MIDKNTLPEGWAQKPCSFGGAKFYLCSKDEWYFYTQTPFEGTFIARALSGPTIEDAKALVSDDLMDRDKSQSGDYYDALIDVLRRLDTLAPTPAPDLTQNTTAHGLLPKETQEAFESLPNEAAQLWDGSRWIAKRSSLYSSFHTYRQNPDWTPEPLTKPDVPWDVLADEIINAVKVETGPNEWTIYGCLGAPSWNEDRQTWMGGNSCRMLPMSEIMTIDPGTCHPRDSLVQRPKGDR